MSRCKESIVIRLLLSDSASLFFFRIEALMYDGHKRSFSRKKHKWNIAEEDHQKDASEDYRWDPLLAFDILED